jgi:hypothetical protein
MTTEHNKKLTRPEYPHRPGGLPDDKPLNLQRLHTESNGISPYLCCPWCGYTDCTHEFGIFWGPKDNPETPENGCTICNQCNAAGWSGMFVLAYNPNADLGEDNKFRQLYLSMIEECGG